MSAPPSVAPSSSSGVKVLVLKSQLDEMKSRLGDMLPTCPICLSHHTTSQWLVGQRCGHIVCKECYARMVKKSECPTCRVRGKFQRLYL